MIKLLKRQVTWITVFAFSLDSYHVYRDCRFNNMFHGCSRCRCQYLATFLTYTCLSRVPTRCLIILTTVSCQHLFFSRIVKIMCDSLTSRFSLKAVCFLRPRAWQLNCTCPSTANLCPRTSCSDTPSWTTLVLICCTSNGSEVKHSITLPCSRVEETKSLHDAIKSNNNETKGRLWNLSQQIVPINTSMLLSGYVN